MMEVNHTGNCNSILDKIRLKGIAEISPPPFRLSWRDQEQYKSSPLRAEELQSVLLQQTNWGIY